MTHRRYGARTLKYLCCEAEAAIEIGIRKQLRDVKLSCLTPVVAKVFGRD
jgi:hypothetical protein